MKYYSVTYISDSKHHVYIEAHDVNDVINHIDNTAHPYIVMYYYIQEITKNELPATYIHAKTTYCMVKEEVLSELVQNYIANKNQTVDCYDEIMDKIILNKIER